MAFVTARFCKASHWQGDGPLQDAIAAVDLTLTGASNFFRGRVQDMAVFGAIKCCCSAGSEMPHLKDECDMQFGVSRGVGCGVKSPGTANAVRLFGAHSKGLKDS